MRNNPVPAKCTVPVDCTPRAKCTARKVGPSSLGVPHIRERKCRATHMVAAKSSSARRCSIGRIGRNRLARAKCTARSADPVWRIARSVNLLKHHARKPSLL